MPFSTLDQIKNAVDNIVSLNRPWYNVSLSGGEPTLHPHFFDIINLLHENLKERLNALKIISNGSQSLSFYEKLIDIAKSVNIQLKISIHTDHVNMEHILELIENLSGHLNLSFSLMFNPDRREEVYLIYDILFELRKKYPFNLKIVPLRDGDRVDSRHTQEDFEWYEKNSVQFQALENITSSKFSLQKNPKHSLRIFHDIELNGERKIIERDDPYSFEREFNYINGLLHLTEMYCVAHVAVLSIEENGLCRGMVCIADPVICNIYEENSLKSVQDNLVHAVQCPLTICGCGHNDLCPKFSSINEATRFIEVVRKKQKRLFAEYDAAHTNQTN